MWDQDWARLGLEPTADLAAIKKAYALKLKTTRPDDDAEAYQALRGAYERAQQWARWQALNAAETEAEASTTADEAAAAAETGADVARASTLDAGDAAGAAESSGHPDTAAGARPGADDRTPAVTGRDDRLDDPRRTPPAAPDDREPSLVAPQVLIEPLELAWRRDGADGLAAAWPRVQAALRDQPLTARRWHSTAFAQWLVNLPQLPSDFVLQLDAEFGWRTDFRSHQTLGAELAQALEETLDSHHPRAIGDPALQARARPLHALLDGLHSGRMASTLGLLFLLHPTVQRELAALGPALLRRLGVELHDQSLLATWLNRAGLLRLGLAAGLFWLAAAAAGEGWMPATTRTLTWAVASGFAIGAAYIVGHALAAPPGRLGRWLRGWGQHRAQPALGLGMLAAIAALSWVDRAGSDLLRLPVSVPVPSADNRFTLLLGLPGFIALLGAWPRHPERGCTAVGLIGLCCGMVVATDPAAGLTATALWGCCAWVLLGAAVAEGRVALPAAVTWLLRPVLNAMLLSQRWGPLFSLLPVAAAAGYALLPGLPVRASGLFLTWVLSQLALATLQSRADAWCLSRLLPRPLRPRV